MGRPARSLLLVLIVAAVAATSAQAQTDPLVGQWSWLNGTVTVTRSGSGWVGATDAAVNCGGHPDDWRIASGGPQTFNGTVAWYEAEPACTPFGHFAATYTLGEGARAVQICGPGPFGITNACTTAIRKLPVLGKSVAVSVVRGTVRIKVKGSRKFRKLKASEVVPTGSTLDTRKGRVRLSAAGATAGDVQTADFFDGIFKVTQRSTGLVDLRLAGRLENCKRSRKSSATRRRRKGRRLWGDGKGRFRTRGKRSAALVRGTRWLVYDQCDSSTYNAVTRGTVDVRDFRRRKTIKLTAGGRTKYIAR